MHNIKIMEIIYSFEIGGSEVLAANIAIKLKQHKLPVSVCATHTGQGPISKKLKAALIDNFGLNLDNLSSIQKRIVLYKFFKKQKPDVLHIHHTSIFILCFIPAKLAGIKKIILTEHNEIDLLDSLRLRLEARIYCKFVNAVTVIHYKLFDYFKTVLKTNPTIISVIYNGVDSNQYKPRNKNNSIRKKINIKQEAPLFACVARLHSHKNHETIIRAFSLLKDKVKELPNMVFIGDGPLKLTLTDLINKLGLAGKITLLGEMTDIHTLLNDIDCLVLSSITEGLPLVILEAMSSGVPCISTNVGGVSEIIDSETGLLFEPYDHITLADHILTMLDEDTRSKMGKISRDKVLRIFDEQLMIDAYIHKLCD